MQVKKIVVISLLSIYALSATELHQLLKLPALIEHYFEHTAEDKDLSFWAFLHIHYAHGIVVDDDYEKDMKLPFKSTNDCAAISVSTPPPSSPYTPIPQPVVVAESKKVFIKSKDLFLKSSYLSCIWQPPKSC